ncbi:MAG: hypothetical protein V8Q75_03350 [Bacilli bacterium]
MKISIRLKDKETGKESNSISIEDLIYSQNEIEFEFGHYEDEDYGTLPYKDFLFFRHDYEVIVKVGE